MLRKTIPLFTFLIIGIGCSSDNVQQPDLGTDNPPTSDSPTPPDNPEPEVEEPKDPVFDVSVIYDSDGKTMQADINSDSENIEVFNLTDELGVDNLQNEHSFTQDESIFFFSWYFEESKVLMKNLETGLNYIKDNFCEFTPEPDVVNQIVLASGNSDYLFYIYRKILPDDFEYYVEIFNINSDECKTIPLPEPNTVQSPFYYALDGDILAVSYFFEEVFPSITHITLIDLSTGEIVKRLEFKTNEIFTTTVNANKYYIFYKDFTYEIYDIANDTFSGKRNSANVRFHLDQVIGKLFSTTFLENSMVTKVQMPQPGSQIFAPAVYDLELDQIVGGADFLLQLQNEIFETTGRLPFFGDFDVDIESSSLAIGYGVSGGTGGIVFANFDLEIYKTILLDFVPGEIIIRDIN